MLGSHWLKKTSAADIISYKLFSPHSYIDNWNKEKKKKEIRLIKTLDNPGKVEMPETNQPTNQLLICFISLNFVIVNVYCFANVVFFFPNLRLYLLLPPFQNVSVVPAAARERILTASRDAFIHKWCPGIWPSNHALRVHCMHRCNYQHCENSQHTNPGMLYPLLLKNSK